MQLLFLVSLFVAAASAFSHAGSFERMYVYYAMKVDAALNGGEPKFIAAGCGKDCSFNKFIGYVEGVNPPPNITGSSSPSVMSTASLLTQHGYNGRLATSKVMPDHGSDYGGVLEAIAAQLDALKDQITAQSSVMTDKGQAQLAATYALQAREIAINDFIAQALKKKNYEVSVTPAEWEGYDNPPEIVSLSATITRNADARGLKKGDKAINKLATAITGVYDKANKFDNSHKRMLANLQSVIDRLASIA